MTLELDLDCDNVVYMKVELQMNFSLVLRVKMFQYLYGHTVQMTVYGHAITYGTIGTVVAGILAAFASKILLQEISAI